MNYRRWLVPIFYNHMPATEIARKLPDLWDCAYKFTVDRHPYDKVLSLASFRLGRKGDYSRDDLIASIEATISNGDYLNYPLYTEKGSVIVDDVIPYDQFWMRLREFSDSRQLRFPETIPKAKANFRKDFATRDFLTDQQKKKIQSDAGLEFEILQWEK